MRPVLLSVLASLAACAPGAPDRLTLTLTNVSDDATYTLAPGLLVRATDADTVFVPGEAASEGLERLAEQGDPSVLKAAMDAADGVGDTSFFGDASVENYAEAAVVPGASASVTMDVVDGEVFVLAMMVGASNDTFLGTVDGGIDPFDLDWPGPIDISDRFAWWDAGTEVDEPLGEGANQPANSEPGAGEDEGGVVSDGAEAGWPAIAEVMEVVIEAAE